MACLWFATCSVVSVPERRVSFEIDVARGQVPDQRAKSRAETLPIRDVHLACSAAMYVFHAPQSFQRRLTQNQISHQWLICHQDRLGTVQRGAARMQTKRPSVAGHALKLERSAVWWSG